ETADGDPATLLEFRQAFKDRASPLGVAAAAHFAGRLVVENAAGFLGRSMLEGFAVYGDAGALADPVAEGGRLAVDTDPAFLDPALHFPARAEAGAGQHFLQLFTRLLALAGSGFTRL